VTASPRPTRTQQRLPRVLAIAAAAAVLGIAAACSSDSVSAPQLKPANSKTTTDGVSAASKSSNAGLIPSAGLLRTTALSSDVSVSQVIGSRGGSIELPEAGLTLSIPSGAIIGGPLMITVTAVAGNTVAYEFLPHGTQFAKPLQFEQTLKGTNWEKVKIKTNVVGGYFRLRNQLDAVTGASLLDETYPITIKGKRMTFDIVHFSGYMVSTGRSDSGDSAL
jgi:hypothetical protein